MEEGAEGWIKQRVKSFNDYAILRKYCHDDQVKEDDMYGVRRMYGPDEKFTYKIVV
jgi:hypothetical protein